MQQTTDAEEQAIDEAQVLCFGLMDPCDWAATLSTKLLAATQALDAARKHHLDPAKDVAASTNEISLSQIRGGVTQYLAEIYTMLHSMPMIQRQPEILESLQFIVAGIAGIDRGAAPDWLAVRATKRHLKRLDLEAEWVPIIAALELLLLVGEKPSVDGVAKEIQRRTGRSVGTIKDWHRRLYRKGGCERPHAKEAIQGEIDAIRPVIALIPKADRNSIIQRRVDELLG